MTAGKIVVHALSDQEQTQIDAALLARGLDPNDFRSEAVEFPQPSYGEKIRHVRMVAGNVQSLLWSGSGLSWLDRLTQQLDAGLFDAGGAAHRPDCWLTLQLPFEVCLTKIAGERGDR